MLGHFVSETRFLLRYNPVQELSKKNLCNDSVSAYFRLGLCFRILATIQLCSCNVKGTTDKA